MKIVFFGTSDFAVPLFNALSSKHEILGVVTAPDKKKGRGRKLGASPIKALAQKRGLLLLQPEALREITFIKTLNSASAELFVVCAYGKILTKEILQLPKNYALNLHASLLPKYRGAAPINWAVVKGEKESGITVFKMDEHMDRGEIILQQKTDLSDSETSLTLGMRLSEIGAQAVLEAIGLIESGRATFARQDEGQASYAPRLKKEDGLIDWGLEAYQIHNRIRGLKPWPGAFTHLEGKLLKILAGKVMPGPGGRAPGQIAQVGKEGILVQTGKDGLLLTSLQLEGKRRMSASEFILGHKIKSGEKLGK